MLLFLRISKKKFCSEKYYSAPPGRIPLHAPGSNDDPTPGSNYFTGPDYQFHSHITQTDSVTQTHIESRLPPNITASANIYSENLCNIENVAIIKMNNPPPQA